MLVDEPLEVGALFVGEGAARAEGASAARAGEGALAAAGIGRPPATDRFAADAEEVGDLGLGEAQFAAAQGP